MNAFYFIMMRGRSYLLFPIHLGDQADIAKASRSEGAVKFTVTRQMMQAIFTESPGVHKVWLEKVAHYFS